MNLEITCLRFAHNADRIRAMTGGLSPDEARWKASPGTWSMLEVMCHLLDEEREDFRLRIDTLLHRPGEQFAPIDPEGWVAARAYNDRDLAETLAAFLGERERSIAWLRALPGTAPWDRVYPDPRLKNLRAGDLLASWLAHDILHLRQMAKIHFLMDEKLAEPYATFYAGSW